MRRTLLAAACTLVACLAINGCTSDNSETAEERAIREQADKGPRATSDTTIKAPGPSSAVGGRTDGGGGGAGGTRGGTGGGN